MSSTISTGQQRGLELDAPPASPGARPARPSAKRQRMYLFERGYGDFAGRLGRLWSGLSGARLAAWRWCWSGPGVKIARAAVFVAVLTAGLAVGRAYLLYERARGGALTAGVIASTVFAVILVVVLLFGWSVPATALTRLLGGVSAAGAVAAVALAGALAVIGVFTPYLLVLVALTAASALLFIPIRVVHGGWMVAYRIGHRCPYDDCGESKLPIHVCECQTEYADLRPNFYGIFYHRCEHADGRVVNLPTLDALGRRRLRRLCGACKRPLVHSSLGELPEQPVLVAGAPGAGKSVFLRQAFRRLRERLAASAGNSVRIDSADQERDVERDLAQLRQGQILAKTAGQVTTALGVAVRLRRPRPFRRLLQIYDNPGEVFESERALGRKQILPYLGGVVLLVDPASLPAIAELASAGVLGVDATDTPFQQVVTSLLGGLISHGLVDRSRKCAVKLAVVLGKADALATTSAAGLLTQLERVPVQDADTSALTRKTIETLGGGNGLRSLEQSFTEVRYFVATALGRSADPGDERPFQPLGVEAPFLWLMGLEGAG
jgi:hypothetical protein